VALRIKSTIALVAGLLMSLAFLVFARWVILIAEDLSRPGVLKNENTVGLIVAIILAGVSLFEAYRFLSFFVKKQPGL